MKKIILNIALLCCATFTASAAYTGRVFVDLNNNGMQDRGEKPMAGVAVSDGLNVVKTAKDGTFSLPGHERERFIFITTPSGYKTDNKHYIRIDGQKSYDFGLQPYTGGIRKDGSHKYVHIADTEIFNTENHGDWVDNVRDYIANEQAAFIMHTGDICYEKGMKAHIELMNTTNMNCPVFYAIGNHDLVKGKYGEELFESIYGPVFYSFDAGSTHYIVTPMLGGDYKPGYTKEDVYRWLRNDLAQIPAGKPIVVFNHDLLTYSDRFIYGISEQEQIDLNAHNLKAWVYGHWHINYMKKQGDVYSISTATLDKGGIDHSTSVFRVLHVDKKGDFVSELRYTYLDKHIQIATPAEGQVPVLLSGAVPLSVNVYSSATPVKEVTYTCLADGKTLFTGKKLSKATDWCWNAEVPLTARQEGKAIALKLKARFNNGDIAESETAFTYHQAEQPEVKLAGEWTNLLGNPQHAATPAPALGQPLKMAWIKNVGANIYMTSPLVYNGKIYVASVDEDLKGDAHIYALDGKTGSILWKYPVRNSIKGSIAIDHGCVLAQDAQGYLYAVDAESSQLNWEKQLPVNGLPALIEGLVAANGIVYGGTGKGLCAIDTKDGRVIWQNQDWRQGEGTTTTFSVGQNVLIASSQWNALYGNDLKTGKLKWTANTNGLRNRGSSVAVHGNLLYLISEKSFFILDEATGRVIVRKEMPFSVDVTSTPLLTDKEIIFGSAKDGLIALDNETLEIKWKFNTGDALVYTSPYSRRQAATIETSPVLAGNTVYVGASDGTIYGINKEDGQAVWRHATGAPIFGTLAVSGNALIAVDFGGNVYTFVSPL